MHGRKRESAVLTPSRILKGLTADAGIANEKTEEISRGGRGGGGGGGGGLGACKPPPEKFESRD